MNEHLKIIGSTVFWKKVSKLQTFLRRWKIPPFQAKDHHQSMEPQQQHSYLQHRRPVRGVMTEEQMQVLQQQIAAFTALQEQLHNWYLSISLSSSPMDPNIVDPNPYSHKLARRTRWNPTPEQLEVLEQFGEEKMNPSKEEIKMLAADLMKHGEITESNVYNWYQNRRARMKKKRRQQQQHHSDNNDTNNSNRYNNMVSEMGSETSSKSSTGGNDSKTCSEQVVANGGDLGTTDL